MTDNRLQQEHEPNAIRQRLNEPARDQLIPDAILGGIDGCITTFAIVSATMGAGFISTVAVVLGFANLFADAFSMAVSNYESRKADFERAESLRATEALHISEVPEGEREELRQIFSRKGFTGDSLESVITTLSQNRAVWIDTMLTEEYGIQRHPTEPLKAGAVTFLAFLSVGCFPLIPFLLSGINAEFQFFCSAVSAALLFFLIGFFKGRAFSQPGIAAGIKTLLTGGLAASIAFATGYGFNQIT